MPCMRLIGVARLNGIRLLYLPSVYFPGNDSRLLADALAGESLKGADVLDLCTGSGFLAITAAKMEARTVTAVDISRRAVASAKMNVGLNRARVEVRHGHLFDGLPEGARFDVIVTNPPWVPAVADDLPSSGIARAWDAGRTGRILLDRICAQAPSRLRPGGVLLVVHGAVCGTRDTDRMLTAQGLAVEVAARRVLPITELLRERARTLAGLGSWGPEERTYELVVMRGQKD
jgi:release factor glutamine methyltransferase